MISIIICTRKSDIASTLKENIQNTIGCEYELVVIDNSDNRHSIFTAYNEGVRRAKGDILCFMHDDILYHTNGWGPIIQKHFQDDPEIGLIGVAGSHINAKSPIYWSNSPFISEHNLHNDNGSIIECFHHKYYNEKGIAEVASVDGMCFLFRKELFDSIRFDNITYQGFHAYDMDICMQVHQTGYKVVVCNTFLIEHFWSESACSTKKGMELFEKNLILFAQKWNNHLPMCKGLDFMTPTTLLRLNNLMSASYDAKCARRSKAYKLGRALLNIPKGIFLTKKN